MVWSEAGPTGQGRAEMRSHHPAPGWAEQDPEDWWRSVVSACGQLSPAVRSAISVIAFAAARETFVPVDGDGRPLGPGILWSDRRAGVEAVELGKAGRAPSGLVLDAGSPLAKLTWLERHQPERLAAARWIMAPRDLIVWRFTGQAITDRTLAGRAGFVDGVERVPRILESTDVAGKLDATVADRLGLPPGIPVVVGAGDRACEVLGSGATRRELMVSWGTTANVSVPMSDAVPPAGATVSPGALGGSIVECGLSAAGDALEWLGRITGRPTAELLDLATQSPPGAAGVVAVPWFNGARAPWWQPGAQAAFLHLATGHGAGDLARALFEGVAWEVARSIEALGGADRVIAAGGGALSTFWPELVAAVTGVSVRRCRSPELASVGACLIASAAMGLSYEREAINPDVSVVVPAPDVVERYRQLRPRSDQATQAILDLLS